MRSMSFEYIQMFLVSTALLSVLILLIIVRTGIVLRQIKNGRQRREALAGMIQIRSTDPRRAAKVNTLVVLGSGGHTTEMLHLLSSIDAYKIHAKNREGKGNNNGEQKTQKNLCCCEYAPLNYIVASTDTTSINRLHAFTTSKSNQSNPNASTNSTNTNTNTNTNTAATATATATMNLPPHNQIYKIPRAREVGQSYLSSIFTTLHSLLSSFKLILLQPATRPDLLLINGPGTCLPIAFWTFAARILGLSRGRIVFCESFCRVQSLSLTGYILHSLGIVDLFLVHWPELLLLDGGEIGGDRDGGEKSVKRHRLRESRGKRMVLIDSFIRHDQTNAPFG